MITASRTHRHFNVDKYLDQQLAQAGTDKAKWEKILGHPVISVSEPTDEQIRQLVCELDRSRFRRWAIRLNARIERWMDSVDWKRLDIWIGTISGFALTGFILYMAYIVTDAWLQGRFNLGGN
jgi:hypothetical protein